MRQHVNPLSKHFSENETIPTLSEIFEDPKLPLHLDIGSAAGDFLFQLALENNNWNYFGIEIRERLVIKAKARLKEKKMKNLYFLFGNANNIFNDSDLQSLVSCVESISFNFPDPWFKKKHYKRRVIQPDLINLFSDLMKKGSLIFVKTDVKELFDYMDLVISSNFNFQKINNTNLISIKSFNPNKIQTNREKYVKDKEHSIYESIFAKI